MKSEFFIDDRREIAQELSNMSKEERRKEVARLEEEERVRREARNRQSAVS